MKKIKNLTIGGKYGIAVGITILCFLISTGIIFTLSNDVEGDIEALKRRGDRSIITTQMASLFRTKDIRIADYINSKNENLITQYEAKRAQFEELQATIKPKIKTTEMKKLFKQIDQNDSKVNNIFLQEIIPALKKNDTAEYNRLRKETIKLRAETVTLLEQLHNLINKERDLAIEDATSSIDWLQLIQIIAIVISTLLGVLITYLISRNVSKNLNKVINVSNEIAQKNLKVNKIDYQSTDEIGQLANSINNMIDNLKDIIENLSIDIEDLTAYSEELSASAEEGEATINTTTELVSNMSLV